MTRRDDDHTKLHAVFAETLLGLVKVLRQEKIPLELFEAYRDPRRQLYLFKKRPRVTRAKPWKSMHQYGLAADFVLKISGRWTWSTDDVCKAHWKRYRELIKEHGLQCYDFELPHCHLAGFSISDLRGGHYPANGGEKWANNMEAMIAAYPTGAPPVPDELVARPPWDWEGSKPSEHEGEGHE